MLRIFMLLFAALLSLLFSGCFGEKLPDGMPKLFPATITITYDDGKPVPDANILLVSENKNETGAWTHAGNCYTSGIATILTQGKYPGLPAGTYKVIVTKEVTEGKPSPGTPIDAESAKKYNVWKKSADREKRFQCVENIYGKTETTPLKVTIDKKSNDLTIKVGKEIKKDLGFTM